MFQSPAPPQWYKPALDESLPSGGANSRTLVLNSLLGSLKPGTYRLTMSYSASYPMGAVSIWSEPIPLEIISKE